MTELDPDAAVASRWLRCGNSNDINAGGIVVGSVAEEGSWFARNWRKCVTSSYKDASKCEYGSYRLRVGDAHCELHNLGVTLAEKSLQFQYSRCR